MFIFGAAGLVVVMFHLWTLHLFAVKNRFVAYAFSPQGLVIVPFVIFSAVLADAGILFVFTSWAIAVIQVEFFTDSF